MTTLCLTIAAAALLNACRLTWIAGTVRKVSQRIARRCSKVACTFAR
jgi:hypothetical protein